MQKQVFGPVLHGMAKDKQRKAQQNPNTISYRFREAVKKAKIRLIPLHGLRHTHISQLVSEGLPIAMVAARAGHSSPNVTLGTYSHYMPGQQAGAVQSAARFSRKRARQGSRLWQTLAGEQTSENRALPKPPRKRGSSGGEGQN